MNQNRLTRFRQSPTARLTAIYLVIFMAISASFSLVLYYTCTNQLGHMLASTNGKSANMSAANSQFLHTTIGLSAMALREKLIFLNLLALIVGSILSYYFTKRTLHPIEQAMAAQSRFVTDASHELRTPLTVMLTSNEVSLRKFDLNLKSAKDIIASNVEEITNLKELTDGLLRLAKQDDTYSKTSRASIQDIASEAMNRVLKAAQAKQIPIEDSTRSLYVQGSISDLVQAIVVLLDNAIKYSPSKSTIYIKGYKKDRQAYIEVRDSGIGISAQDLPHIFERFYRSDASRARSAVNGYGIGLSIAEKIVRQHKGKILASSQPNKGSIFAIALPLATET